MAQPQSIYIGRGGGGSAIEGIANIGTAPNQGINIVPTGSGGPSIVHFGDLTDAIVANPFYEFSVVISGDGSGELYPEITLAGNNATPGQVNLLNARGTPAVPTAIQGGDELGVLLFSGFAATDYINGGLVQLIALATQNFTAAHGGSKLEVLTTPNDSITPAVALLLDQDQSVTVSPASAAGGVKLGPHTTAFGTLPTLFAGNGNDYVAIGTAGHGVMMGVDGTHVGAFQNDSGFALRSGASFGWASSATDATAGNDTELVRGASGQVNVTTGDGVTGGILNAASFKAGGTQGVTAGPFTVITAITVKGGLVTAITGS